MPHYKAQKIKLSWLWLPALILFPYLHMVKIIFFIFLILTVHELSHIFVAYLFHYRIEKIILYPFGLSAIIPQLGYGSIFQEICIIAAGPLSQILFPSVFHLLLEFHLISYSFYEYLLMMNANIMIFNLLPIYPLDGGRLLQSLFHSLTSFRNAQYLTCIGSIGVLIVFFFLQISHGLSALFVQVFLFFQIVICFKDIHYMQLKFFHYRYHHPIQLPPYLHSKNDLYRARYNIIKAGQGWLDEKAWLARRFDNRKR